MQTEDPLDILADVEVLRQRTSSALDADGWQWMTVWGVVAFGAGLTAFIDALDPIAGFHWMVAVPVALGVTALLERRSKEQRAAERDSRPTASLLSAGLGILASDPFAAYSAISMLFAGLLAGSAVHVYSRYRTA